MNMCEGLKVKKIHFNSALRSKQQWDYLHTFWSLNQQIQN